MLRHAALIGSEQDSHRRSATRILAVLVNVHRRLPPLERDGWAGTCRDAGYSASLRTFSTSSLW
jgi:hypothetical protein